MQPSFTKQLSLCISKTNISSQKIDGSRFETFDIVIASFLVNDKHGRSCFFGKTFLLADISIDAAFGMFFLTLGNIKINFND